MVETSMNTSAHGVRRGTRERVTTKRYSPPKEKKRTSVKKRKPKKETKKATKKPVRKQTMTKPQIAKLQHLHQKLARQQMLNSLLNDIVKSMKTKRAKDAKTRQKQARAKTVAKARQRVVTKKVNVNSLANLFGKM